MSDPLAGILTDPATWPKPPAVEPTVGPLQAEDLYRLWEALVQRDPQAGPVGEPGPLVVVLGHHDREQADAYAREACADSNATLEYIGRGWVLTGDAYAPDGLWLHAYATTYQPGSAT